MPVPTITLRGAAMRGAGFAPVPGAAKLADVGLSTTVKLGKLPAREMPDCPKLRTFLPAGGTWRPPAAVDWTKGAAASLGTMLGNDQWGDCVIAGKGHSVGVWSASDNDSGGEVIPTTEECVQAYHRICGPGDNGCIIANVLEVMTTGGITFGGQTRKLDGYVSVDFKNVDEVKAAIALFGSLTLGINFPSSWQNSAVWDRTGSRVVGGHDVPAVRYDQRGLYVSSWGRIYLMTWAALAQPGRVDEAYALLSPNWYNGDHIAPSGFDVPALKSALLALGAGVLPDPTPPTPPEPPAPPTPPTPAPCQLALEGQWGPEGWFRGTATPMPAGEPAMPGQRKFSLPFDSKNADVVQAWVDAINTMDGVECCLCDDCVEIDASAIDPNNLAAILAFLMELVKILGPLFIH